MDQNPYRDLGSRASHPGASYGQQDVNMLKIIGHNVPPPITLPGQVDEAHSMVERLANLIDGLEKRLGPVLAPSYPEPCGTSAKEQTSQPVLIEEMERLITRLRIVCNHVTSIEMRTRI